MLILISLLVVAFGQPAWIRGFGPLAAAIGFALFWKSILAFSPKKRFLVSLFWFASVQAIQLSWMTTLDYMGPFILVVYLFLILAMGAQFGILSFFLSERVTFRRSLAMASFWALCEWVRLFFFCGFTWNPLGLSLTDSFYSLQFATVFGIFGLSFWVILVNALGLNALLKRSTKNLLVFGSFALFPYLFGLLHQNIREANLPSSGDLNIALVQTALFPEQKELLSEDPTAYIPPLTQWERIFNELSFEKKIDLLVLPEAALPLGAHRACYSLASIKSFFEEKALPPLRSPYAVFHAGEWRVSNAFVAQALANKFDAHVVVGLDDRDLQGQYNAAFHFYPQNIAYERYEKRILVPVAEYVPLPKWRKFSRFIAKQFGIFSSFNAGTEAKIFKAHVPLGVTICLEETFSNLSRDLRKKGAEVLVSLTNDVWFPGSKLPQQHFYHGRLRAVENGIPLLRSCNTGVTAIVDCFGRSVEQIPASEEKPSVLYLNFPIRSYSTLYTWWGDQAIIGFSLGSLLTYFLFKKKKLP
jgi:apolipoprotein N-acyltransferase